ncbi:TetR/AcrR family transcriptional regulator [uncultured Oceanicoccus sp.]|uniref:TetR/AcrR family transcriptional regulator n=1 Tax=uncultured Oceanicoccus sp. TaxID=1706381 RepID=UPI0030DA6C41
MKKTQSNNVIPITQAKKLKPVNTRKKIIDAYIELITKQGFSATTHKQLAEKTQVSSSTIYHHFAKKTDLYEALIDRAHKKFLTLIDDEDMFAGTLETRVSLLVSLSWDFFQSQLYLASLEIRIMTRKDPIMVGAAELSEHYDTKRTQRLRQILVGANVNDRELWEALTYGHTTLIGLCHETIRKPKLDNIDSYLWRISRNMVKMLKSAD